MTAVRRFLALATAVATACSTPSPDEVEAPSSTRTPTIFLRPSPSAVPTAGAGVALGRLGRKEVCGGGERMTVHFYDVGQALAALVDLPDGRHLLVDTGDSPRRPGCGDACSSSAQHLLDGLRTDLRGRPIDLLWITHQHADHIGGAPAILKTFEVGVYADNGRDARKPEVLAARRAGAERGTDLRVVDPNHPGAPVAGSAGVSITPILPASWPPSCSHNANDCSIALRVDFCASSVLFAGDAERGEDAQLDPRGEVTLLQVAHHGSETSTTPAFLSRVRPSYAVISVGKPGRGMNFEYCHPRALIVKRLTTILGGPGTSAVRAFDGDRCDRATLPDWIDVPTSDRLWLTERDGDVVLTTTGDGKFERQ